MKLTTQVKAAADHMQNMYRYLMLKDAFGYESEEL